MAILKGILLVEFLKVENTIRYNNKTKIYKEDDIMSDPGIFIIAVIVPLIIILGIFIPQQLKREEKKNSNKSKKNEKKDK